MTVDRSAQDIVISHGARTPFGKLNGGLVRPHRSRSRSARHPPGAGARGVSGDAVDAVIMGQVIQAGAGQGPARQAAVAAGIGWDVPTITINKICLSGLTAVIDAARLIRPAKPPWSSPAARSRCPSGPHLLPRSRKGWIYGDVTVLDSVAWDGLIDAFDHLSMGASTERSIAELGISREDQDAVAAASHQRATAAASDGIFDHEIAPVSIPNAKATTSSSTVDEGVRANVTAESLARTSACLRPAERHHHRGQLVAAQRRRRGSGGDHPGVRRQASGRRRWPSSERPDRSPARTTRLHSQPARAIEHALKRAELSITDLDFIEINEAFSAVAIQSLKELGYSRDQTNLHGGAIAVGHPLGASGARLALHAALELSRRGTGHAAVSLCGGGGQGEALILSAA